MHRLSVLGLVIAATFVGPATGTAAAADTVAAAGSVEVYLPAEAGANPRNVLRLLVFPQRGVAVVDVSRGFEFDDRPLERNSYAIAIPKGRFEGSIDLKFPGLGEISGQITSSRPSKTEFPAKVCKGRVPVTRATFEGELRFDGLGDDRTWAAQKAEGGVRAECGLRPTKGMSEAEVLFGALAEFRPLIIGPNPFRFLAGGPSRGRALEFLAFGRGSLGTYLAVDKEWLPGDVAAERAVSTTTRSYEATVEVGPGGAHPDRITFTPPAPFFGHATYRRRTHKLRGSLGARFLGLSLRLARPPLPATVEDEERRQSKRVDRAF